MCGSEPLLTVIIADLLKLSLKAIAAFPSARNDTGTDRKHDQTWTGSKQPPAFITSAMQGDDSCMM